MATLVFHDSMIQPKFLDISSIDWMYPIEKQPLSSGDSRNARHRIYRSRRIKMPSWLSDVGATDLSVYLHNAGDAVSDCVHIYAWKTTLLPYDPTAGSEIISYARVGVEDFYDFTPITYNPDTNVAMFNLKVADVWDAMQIVVAQPCTAVSVFLNPKDQAYPTGYLKVMGSLIPPPETTLPLRDDFDGVNSDWETP